MERLPPGFWKKAQGLRDDEEPSIPPHEAIQIFGAAQKMLAALEGLVDATGIRRDTKLEVWRRAYEAIDMARGRL